MGILSGGHRSIDKWCYAYNEFNLVLILDVITCLHWKTKLLIRSIINEDFLIILIMMLEDFEIWCFGEII